MSAGAVFVFSEDLDDSVKSAIANGSGAETARRHTATLLELPKVLERIATLSSTAAGAEAVRALAPTDSLEALEREHARLVEAARLLSETPDLAVGPLADPRPAFADAAVPGSHLEPIALVGILDLLRSVDRLRRALAARADLPLLGGIAGRIVLLPSLAALLARTVDAEGRVLDTASPALARIRREIETTRETIRARLESRMKALADDGVLQERVITIRGGRFVLPVKIEEKGRVPGIVHDESASGATLFIEPIALVPLNNRVTELIQEEAREVRAILLACTEAVRAALDALRDDLEVLTEVDVLLAKARYGRAVRGALPRWSRRGALRLVGARHPLLLDQLGEAAIPFDLAMEEGTTTLLLSGANTGGKTVALKTIGLLALLAQCGVPIPAAEGTELPIFSETFADIGDEQSIEASLSSFSARLVHVREVLERADAASLVLLDEVGSGTDPEEGGALAGAVLKALSARGARTVATTHFGFLMDLAAREPGMANASMEFDGATGRPTYRVLTGIPGKSHALEVARGLGVDARVIEEARALLPEGAQRSRELLAELSERLGRIRALEEEIAARDRASAERARASADLRDAIAREEQGLRRRAAESAREIVRRAEREAEEALADVRAARRRAAAGAAAAAGGPDSGAATAARAGLDRLRAARREVERDAPGAPALPGEAPAAVSPGEVVLVAPFGRRATVIAAADAAGRVEILAGSARITVPLSSLRSADAAAGGAAAEGAHVTRPAPREVGVEIDLRGLRAEEAVAAVDRHIDAAVVAGLASVRIIHGLGTGVLRKEIGAFLERDERVRGFRRGEWGEGELGVTIVELH